MKIMETFLSIQGEGVNSGLPTFFIRLAHCNLRCSYCDTKYSYNGGKDMHIEEIINVVKKDSNGFKLVCITGGEPLIDKDISLLIKRLLEEGYQIDIETNGSKLIDEFPNTDNILYSIDIKCPLSGMADKMNFDNLKFVKYKDQIKFIIGDHDDFLYAKNIINKYKLVDKTNIIFSPIGGIDGDKLTRWTLSEKVQARISLQLHKIIWKSDKDELFLVDKT